MPYYVGGKFLFTSRKTTGKQMINLNPPMAITIDEGSLVNVSTLEILFLYANI